MKLVSLAVLIALSVSGIRAQDTVSVSFTGIEIPGNTAVTLDSVKIVNQNNGAVSVLYGPDFSLDLADDTSPVRQFAGSGADAFGLNVVPGTGVGQALALTMPAAGSAALTVYGMDGRRAASFNGTLGQGTHTMHFRAPAAGVYVVCAVTDHGRSVVKLHAVTGNGTASLRINGRSGYDGAPRARTAGTMAGTTMDFAPGNRLQCIGYAAGYTEAGINDAPAADTAYVFTFTAVSNSYAAAVNEFHRDMTIFDGDLARGNNNAAVPLAGTTDAADGSVIEARAVSVEDSGRTSTAWRDIATVTGGAWNGTLNTPVSYSWYRPQVRVKGSDAPAGSTAARFGVGIVFIKEEQSNTHQGLMPGLDKLAGEEEAIGNEPGDFQFIVCANALAGPQPLTYVTDDAPFTASLAAMAATFNKTAPGIKVMGAFFTLSGSSMIDVLNDSRDIRSWEDVLAVRDSLTLDGSEVGMAMMQHLTGFISTNSQLAGVLFGVDVDGNPIPGVSTDSGFPAVTISGGAVNHVWPEAFPGFLTGRIQTLMIGRGPSKPQNITVAEEEDPITFQNLFPDRVQFTFYQHALQQEIVGADLGVHWRKDNQRGYPEWFRMMAQAMLKAADILPFTPPEIDIITWKPEYLELGCSTGPITTRARLEGVTVNFPADPTADPDTPGMAEVLGFMTYNDKDGNYINVTRVEIVDSAGNRAAAGRLRIYPESGTFNGSSRMYWELNGSGIQRPDSGWASDWIRYNHCDHLPIVDVGIPNTAGIKLQPLHHVNEINDANSLSLGEPVFAAVAGSTKTQTATTYPAATAEGLTVHARFIPTPGNALNIIQESGNSIYLTIRCTGEGYLDMDARERFHILCDSMPVTPDTADGFIDLLISINTSTDSGRIEVYLNGEPFDPNGLMFDNTAFILPGDFRGGRAFNLLPGGEASVAFVKLWQNALNVGAAPPAAVPWLEVRADAAGTFTSPDGGTYDIFDEGIKR